MSFFDHIKEWFNANPGKGVGIAAGGLFGILVFIFGFWKLIIIVLLMIIGALVGKLKDDGVSFTDIFTGRFRK